jgi:RND family efflux transporter MFP subunit
VIYKPITEWNEFTGRLEAVKTVEVRPRVGGYIQAVAFKEGALVKKGDLLFQIDPRPFQAEVSRLKAEQSAAESKLALAKSDFERAKRLKDQNAIAVEEFDHLGEAVQSALAQLQATQAALATANLNLEFTRVNSPIEGRASRAVVTEGNLVSGGPSGATLLTTVVSTDKMYAYFDADEQTYLRYARLSREGSLPSARNASLPARLGLVGETGYPHEGMVDFLDNQVNPASGTIRVRAVFDNSKGELTPGLFARVQLPGSATREGVLINDRAVGTDQGKKFVLVVDKANVAQYRPVETGPLVDGLRVVRSGLKEGDVIVVNGLQRVRPGMQVAPTKVAMTEPSPLDRMYAQKPDTEPRPAAARTEAAGGAAKIRTAAAQE